MKKLYILISIVCFAVPAMCQTGCQYDSILYNGMYYHTVTIGNQVWLKENLNVGVMINQNLDQTNNSIIEKYCYDNDTANCNIYGGLYQWDEIMNYSTLEGVQGICPPGWHFATDAEWFELENFVDTTINNPNQTGGRGVTAGYDLQVGGSSGFDALLAGMVYAQSSIFKDYEGRFWTSTEVPNSNCCCLAGPNCFSWWRRFQNGVWPYYIWREDNNGYTGRPKGVAYSARCICGNGTIIGINEDQESNQISLYPNPTDDLITIEMRIIDNQTIVGLYNLNGQEILSQQITDFKFSIDISNIQSGIYFIRITDANSVTVKKLIIE